MIDISEYALPDEVAEQVADEIRELIGSEARAWEQIDRLRNQLADERAKSSAYLFALQVYGWTGQ